jgi:hypothetical protein
MPGINKQGLKAAQQLGKVESHKIDSTEAIGN